jgi:protein-S-isoprenylcysteine O-methyltransferase Ste14
VNKSVKIFLLVVVPMLAVLLAYLGIRTTISNPIGWFLFFTGLIFAIGTVIVAGMRRKRFWESSINGTTTNEERGDRSFWWITISLAVAFFLPPLEFLYFKSEFNQSAWIIAFGLGLIVLGSALFVLARRTLKQAYSGHLSVKTNQTLVRNGPYSLIRHPAYAGYLCMALGISIGYESLSGMINIIALVVSLQYRMNVEEKILIEHFGDSYRDYIKTSKRLIPGVW